MHKPTEYDMQTRPIWPRNPWPNSPRPLSTPIDGASQPLQPNMEVMSQWSPRGTFYPSPYPAPAPDEFGGAINRQQRSGLYDASPNPWPNNGQMDRPNWSLGAILRLKPKTSAHKGFSNPTGPGPTMLFKAPPVFTYQTTPIRAVGA